MHIPDGYLNPQTCAVAYAVAVPTLAVAARKVKRVVKTRHVPTLALFAAGSFLVMMFNLPIPDGTTAHAVGGAVVAVVLGPWAAMISVSVALLFQALLFGDGGVLAYGANVLNIAIVMPLVAYGVYRLISGRAELTSARRVVAAAVAGYVSLTAAALLTGIELGIQPDLFHDASGTPLYSPYHLAQTIPAMLLAHLLVAGVVEAALTAGVLGYLQRANLPLLQVNHPAISVTVERTAQRRKFRPIVVAGIAIGVMTLLTPLGLLAPGGAFGENAPADLNLGKLGLSAVPAGLNQYTGLWRHAIFNGYEVGGKTHPWVGYVLSAVIGILVVGLVVFLIGKAVEAVTKRDSLEKV
jgi:cobalt/nickel transport system permease protein